MHPRVDQDDPGSGVKPLTPQGFYVRTDPLVGSDDHHMNPYVQNFNLEIQRELAKNLTFLSNADAAGIVLGARVPIVLTSRADSVRSRMASCGVAVLYAHARRTNAPLPAA